MSASELAGQLPDPPPGLGVELECKFCAGKLSGNDSGTRANDDLSFYEYHEDGWLMLGHAVQPEVMVVREGPGVRLAESWTRVWTDKGSGRPTDYSIYCPACSDVNYVACGVVFVFGSCGLAEPEPGTRFGLLHKSLVEAVPLGEPVWSDAGVNGKYSVWLKEVPGMGTSWPAMATLMGLPPTAHRIKAALLQRAEKAIQPFAAAAANFGHYQVRGTFIVAPPEMDYPDLLEDPNSPSDRRGRAGSWPPNPGSGRKANIALAQTCAALADMGSLTWRQKYNEPVQRTRLSELPFSEDGPEARDDSGAPAPWKETASQLPGTQKEAFGSAAPSGAAAGSAPDKGVRGAPPQRAALHPQVLRGSDGRALRSPADAMLSLLLPQEAKAMAAACQKLLRWTQARRPPGLPLRVQTNAPDTVARALKDATAAASGAEAAAAGANPTRPQNTRKQFPFRPKRVYLKPGSNVAPAVRTVAVGS